MNFGPQINGIHKFRLENGSVKVNAQFLIEEARRNTWTVVVRNATTNDIIVTETVDTKYLADKIADDWFMNDEHCYVRVVENHNNS